jgi:hypothetical protein
MRGAHHYPPAAAVPRPLGGPSGAHARACGLGFAVAAMRIADAVAAWVQRTMHMHAQSHDHAPLYRLHRRGVWACMACVCMARNARRARHDSARDLRCSSRGALAVTRRVEHSAKTAARCVCTVLRLASCFRSRRSRCALADRIWGSLLATFHPWQHVLSLAETL